MSLISDLVLQYFDGTYYSLQSPIYRWNGTALSQAQALFTHAAVKWLHLTCPSQSITTADSQHEAPLHFLAVLQAPPVAAPRDANESGTDPPVSRVSIFRFHDAKQEFVWEQVKNKIVSLFAQIKYMP